MIMCCWCPIFQAMLYVGNDIVVGHCCHRFHYTIFFECTSASTTSPPPMNNQQNCNCNFSVPICHQFLFSNIYISLFFGCELSKRINLIETYLKQSRRQIKNSNTKCTIVQIYTARFALSTELVMQERTHFPPLTKLASPVNTNSLRLTDLSCVYVLTHPTKLATYSF